jgi:hypothetical protein
VGAVAVCPAGKRARTLSTVLRQTSKARQTSPNLSATWARVRACAPAWPERTKVCKRERSVSDSGNGSLDLGADASDAAVGNVVALLMGTSFAAHEHTTPIKSPVD